MGFQHDNSLIASLALAMSSDLLVQYFFGDWAMKWRTLSYIYTYALYSEQDVVLDLLRV